MTPAEVLDQAQAAGVTLWVEGDALRYRGPRAALTELDRYGNVVLTGLADAIVEHFRGASPVVVGLDPSISFGAGERIVNDNEPLRPVRGAGEGG